MGAARVSVIIPTYNRAYSLGAAVGSLQRQTYPDWEALVIDDGSTDDTAAVITRMQAEDSRIKRHYQPNRGVSAARNAGLKLAAGEWIGFLDSDDTWEPWKLAAQILCFQHLQHVGMVWTDMSAVDASGRMVSARYLRRMYGAYEWLGERPIFQFERPFAAIAPQAAGEHESLRGAALKWGDIFSAMIVGNLVHTSTVLLSRKRAAAVGFFNEAFRSGEDYEFHLRTCREGPVAFLDTSSVRYRLPGGEDQLTAKPYAVEVAKNGLTAREAAIASDAARITLTRTELADILSAANASIAEELFEAGAFETARPYFRRSVRYFWRRPKVFAKALLTLVPAQLRDPLLRAYRQRH
jgi:glycosyltransferase involved in cell wall biosynthesis